MSRYRVALTAVLVLVIVAVSVSWIRGGSADDLSGAASGELLPVAERTPAPNFVGINGWLNSPPLTIDELRGHVVLVDFWTFSCVNCVRTIPHLQQLYDTYTSKGLVIVGVHSPEFDFEKVPANVAAAVKRLGVTWPVAVDSEMATWNAYQNLYWPAEYLIDQEGRIAEIHYGEGDYQEAINAVANLLKQPTVTAHAVPSMVPASLMTPELYAGSERGDLADGEQYGEPGEPTGYPNSEPQQDNTILVTGSWTDEGQYLLADATDHVRLRFYADSVYVVAGPSGSTGSVQVTLDGHAVPRNERGTALSAASSVLISHQDLYPLLAHVPAGYHEIDLTVPAGFSLYTFTFG